MSESKGNDEVKTGVPRKLKRNGEMSWCSLAHLQVARTPPAMLWKK